VGEPRERLERKERGGGTRSVQRKRRFNKQRERRSDWYTHSLPHVHILVLNSLGGESSVEVTTRRKGRERERKGGREGRTDVSLSFVSTAGRKRFERDGGTLREVSAVSQVLLRRRK